jgi:hypothetical protein
MNIKNSLDRIINNNIILFIINVKKLVIYKFFISIKYIF